MNRVIPVTFEKAVFGGLFIGRHEGKAVFVPYALPGETAMVKVTSDKKDYCTGEIESITSASPLRTGPACPHFTLCGGCSYLHVPYETELEIKKGILLESLSRIAGLEAGSLPPVGMMHGERFHYRSHASLKVKGGITGFFRRGTNEIVPVTGTGCLLLDTPINDRIRGSGAPEGDFRVAVDADGVVKRSFDRDRQVTEREAGLVYVRDIDGFFQANRLLRGALPGRVVSLAGCDAASTVLDIGCGVGFLTLPLARESKSAQGIDINAGSIRYARANASQNGIGNVEFLAMRSSRLHPGRTAPDVIVMDPPRAGLDRSTRKTILAMRPRTIVYVSCNPSTYSRDIRDFIGGGYRLEELALADMFPCTQHIEVISRLSLAP